MQYDLEVEHLSKTRDLLRDVRCWSEFKDDIPVFEVALKAVWEVEKLMHLRRLHLETLDTPKEACVNCGTTINLETDEYHRNKIDPHYWCSNCSWLSPDNERSRGYA